MESPVWKESVATVWPLSCSEFLGQTLFSSKGTLKCHSFDKLSLILERKNLFYVAFCHFFRVITPFFF